MYYVCATKQTYNWRERTYSGHSMCYIIHKYINKSQWDTSTSVHRHTHTDTQRISVEKSIQMFLDDNIKFSVICRLYGR